MLCEKCGHMLADTRRADNGGYYGFEVSWEVPEKYPTPLPHTLVRTSAE